jgi:FG-GAP-like repeat
MLDPSRRFVCASAALAVASCVCGLVPAQQFTISSPPASVITYLGADAGDFDGDGDEDIAIAGATSAVRVLRNDGTGAFTDVSAGVPPAQITGVVTNVLFVDVDGDGRDELLLSGYTANNLFGWSAAGVWVDRSASLGAGLGVHTFAAADLDTDGDVDLVAAAVLLGGSTSSLLINNGAGAFFRIPFPPTGFLSGGINTADIDGDGDPDLLFGGSGRLYRNDGGLNFTDVSATQLGGAPPGDPLFGDVDGDADLDLLLTGSTYGVQFWRNSGSGTFSLQPGAVQTLPSLQRSCSLADFDDDGDLDLVRTQQFGLPVLGRNNGLGLFVDDPTALPAGVPSNSNVISFDADGDRDPDLLLTPIFSHAALLRNLHRDVASPFPPSIAQSWPILVWHEPGYATAPRPCWLGIGLVRLPQPITVAPFGRLWLDPGPMLLDTFVLPGGAGPTIRTFGIPNLPALAGIALHVQALIEGTQGLGNAHFTNMISSTIQ